MPLPPQLSAWVYPHGRFQHHYFRFGFAPHAFSGIKQRACREVGRSPDISGTLACRMAGSWRCRARAFGERESRPDAARASQGLTQRGAISTYTSMASSVRLRAGSLGVWGFMNTFDRLLRDKAVELERKAEEGRAILISMSEVLKRSDAYSRGRFQLWPGSNGVTNVRNKAANICSYRVEAGKVIISTVFGGDGKPMPESVALAEIADLIVKQRRAVDSQEADVA